MFPFSVSHTFIYFVAVLQQVHNIFQSEFSTKCDLVLPLSIANILSSL